MSARQYEARTGGSSGVTRPILVGLDLLEVEAPYHASFHAARPRNGRDALGPVAMWLPAPPGAVGLKNALIFAKLGTSVDRWFSQNRLADSPAGHHAFARATLMAAGLLGSAIPAPEHTPASDAGRVARYLADRCARGLAPTLLTTPSAAVRVTTYAVHERLDIEGSFFVVVGEPYTTAKAHAIAQAGCAAASHYAMVECGLIGVACLAAHATDDVHLVSDKIATIDCARTVTGSSTVPAVFHTTLLPSAPKVMLNVESGDYGVIETRDCGCGALPPGYDRHLHTIRSYEKLTSEGMHFLGPDLIALIEGVLPRRFGGTPTAYQMVEREDRGLTKVSVLVSPSVGEVNEQALARTVLEFLRARGIGQRLMAEIWRTGDTIEVVRSEPYVTTAGKVQPLHRLGA